MTPAINVNLTYCAMCRDGDHSSEQTAQCYGAPVLVCCPIPRSVTFSVALGRCICEQAHSKVCPVRPAKVSCSITGETWEESEVTGVELESPYAKERTAQGVIDTFGQICRARWTLVKMLLLNGLPSDTHGDLVPQRDTVFAALADMARAEQDACNAQQGVDEAFPFDHYRRNDPDHCSERPSVGRFAAYVEYLIRHVGALP